MASAHYVHGKTFGTSWHTLGFGLQTTDTASRRLLIPAIVLEMTIPKLKYLKRMKVGRCDVIQDSTGWVHERQKTSVAQGKPDQVVFFLRQT